MPKYNRSQRNYALRYFFGLLLVVVVFVAGPVASYAANAVAMVTDLVGKGVIIEEGKEKPCEILSYLPPRRGDPNRSGSEADFSLLQIIQGIFLLRQGHHPDQFRGPECSFRLQPPITQPGAG